MKKPSEQVENKQQTQPTYDTGPESNAGHIGDRRVLSPQHYMIPVSERVPFLIIAIYRLPFLSCLFFFTSDFNKCDDICPRYSACTNTNGSYVCNCKEGYHKTSDECEDINECKTGAHKCNRTSSKCQNTNGGHYCMCRKGFQKIHDNCVGQCVTFC